MELRRYALIARRWLWLILLATIVAGVAAYVISRRQPAIYEAAATVLVNQAQSTSGPSYNDVLASLQLSKTYANLVQSQPVINEVAKQLGVSPVALRASVSADVVRDTQLIHIHARDHSPQKAAQIADTTAQVFRDQVAQLQGTQLATVETDLQNQIASVQASVDQATRDVTDLSGRPVGLTEEQRAARLTQATTTLVSLNSTLQSLHTQLDDVRISRAKTANSVAIVEPASNPSSPIQPRPLLTAFIAATIGLLVAVGIAALFEYLDDTVKTADDVMHLDQSPVLGFVPRFRQRKDTDSSTHAAALAPYLLASSGEDSFLSEGYRLIRTNLYFANRTASKQTLAITSARPSEGKSTTAANLAVVLARGGQQVILVDADLRRPSIHRAFSVQNRQGLSNLFFANHPSPEDLLQQTAIPTLRLLTSGPLPPNPSDLLSSDQVPCIIRQLGDAADIVLFDTPPILSVSDAAPLAAQLTGVIFVVEAGKTRTGAVKQALTTLRQANVNIVGVILNKQRQDKEGYYHYDKGYGYGYREAGSGG